MCAVLLGPASSPWRLLFCWFFLTFLTYRVLFLCDFCLSWWCCCISAQCLDIGISGKLLFSWVKTIATFLMSSPFESLKPFTKLVKSNFTPQKEKRIWYFSYPGIPPTPTLSYPLHIAFRSLAAAEGFMQIAQLFWVLVKITLPYF